VLSDAFDQPEDDGLPEFEGVHEGSRKGRAYVSPADSIDTCRPPSSLSLTLLTPASATTPISPMLSCEMPIGRASGACLLLRGSWSSAASSRRGSQFGRSWSRLRGWSG